VRKLASTESLGRRQPKNEPAGGYSPGRPSPAVELFYGDLLDPSALRTACRGVEAVYHICPNLHPQEVRIAELLLGAMAHEGVKRIVYHSVLHPQTEAMPHHWRKLRVEELLFTQDVAWTILQPAAYMQNVFAYWQTIEQEGVYRVPYAVNTRLGLVDLADVAAAAATVLLDPTHTCATYELCGPEILDQSEIAAVLSGQLARPVRAEAQDRSQWAQVALAGGQNPDAVQTLLKMFEYYERHGFYGSPRVLAMLLGRKPSTFAEVAARHVCRLS
jgi:uncharacterized protein YbjT (DUF2867 family)